MVSRAVLAFQRFIRDLIRSFRQSLGALQPALGKRKRKYEDPHYSRKIFGPENRYNEFNEDNFL